jgi:BirA family transcriptional regulator, biotin operon repressor / biotin---[acetyl-CoA-carboxylase] ligase
MIGKTIIELVEVDSTNAYANDVFTKNDFEDGAVIRALEQSAGRGQHDHRWISEPGKNLTITVCLKPRFLAPDRQFQLNKAIALGVLDFIRSCLPSTPRIRDLASRIKWPNDIYVGSRKIGGILIENKIMGSVLETSLAGIGINVNQARFEPDIPNPCSLVQILGHETVLKDALRSLCKFLDKRYQELKSMEMVNLDHEFDQNLLGYEQWRTFIRDGVPMEGRVKGVDQNGRLLLETPDGETLAFSHQEIEYELIYYTSSQTSHSRKG